MPLRVIRGSFLFLTFQDYYFRAASATFTLATIVLVLPACLARIISLGDLFVCGVILCPRDPTFQP